MSKIKELERLLVAATDALYRIRRDQQQDEAQAVESYFDADDVSIKDLMKWRRDRRKELAGTKTVKAKVVTKAVEKDREKKDRTQTVKRESKADRRKRNEAVHEAIRKVASKSADKVSLTKGMLLDATVFTSRTTKHKVIGVVRRNGERCAKLDNELVVPVHRLHQHAPGKFQVMPE